MGWSQLGEGHGGGIFWVCRCHPPSFDTPYANFGTPCPQFISGRW